MKVKVKGEAATRKVWINNTELKPNRSQKIINHSPDGFNWGYGGSGPAQLALAILIWAVDVYSKNLFAAKNYHQLLKWDHIAALSMDKDFEIEIDLSKYFPEEK